MKSNKTMIGKKISLKSGIKPQQWKPNKLKMMQDLKDQRDLFSHTSQEPVTLQECLWKVELQMRKNERQDQKPIGNLKFREIAGKCQLKIE
jgi:hypothetical protein